VNIGDIEKVVCFLF